MLRKQKEYLSDPISTELEWINDIRNKDIRLRLKALDLSVSITYTYYIYHNYTVKQLAMINSTTNRQVIVWIMICAYIVDGGKHDFGNGRRLQKKELDLLIKRYPKVQTVLPSCRCVWADTRTGRVICFRQCKGYSLFKSK